MSASRSATLRFPAMWNTSRFMGRVLAAVAAGTCLVLLTACGAQAGAAPGGPDPAAAFTAVPTLEVATAPSFVGTDTNGTAIGLRITGPDTAVAYLCNGRDIGVWFTGRVGDDGTITLEAADGATLTATRSADGVTGTHSAGIGFTLAAATGDTGIYRDVATLDGRTYTTGWVVGNDGSIYGSSGDEDGGVAATVAEGPADGPAGTPDADADPVPTGLIKRIRCGVNNFQAGFNLAKLNNSAPGSAANSTANQNGADAAADLERLGCDSRIAPAA